jgi:hypothetical protein
VTRTSDIAIRPAPVLVSGLNDHTAFCADSNQCFSQSGTVPFRSSIHRGSLGMLMPFTLLSAHRGVHEGAVALDLLV